MKRTEARAKVAQILKICPVCGALNSTARRSCSNCTWYGAFDFDQETVSASLTEFEPETILAMEAGMPEQQKWHDRLLERIHKLVAAVKHRLRSVATGHSEEYYSG